MKQASLAELHLHLDGSLRRSTLEELAAELGVVVPDNLLFEPGMGLEGALSRFAVTLAVLQTPSAVSRVAAEICEDAEFSGVTTLEIRFAPQLHQQAPMEEIVDAAINGSAGRAGIILCGLYGDPPSTFERFVQIAGPRSGVVGIDIAGGPNSANDFGMHNYQSAFKAAREIGLGRTVHAGEGRPAAEIQNAMDLLHAQRIGHGTSLLEDTQVLDQVIERGITIEACPTSNVHTGAIPELRAHPLPKWLELGVKACINTDNTLFSDVDTPTEYQRARQIPGMTDELLDKATEFGHAAKFVRP